MYRGLKQKIQAFSLKNYFLYVFKGYITLAQTGLPVAGKSPRPLLQKLRQLYIIKFNYSFVLKMLIFQKILTQKRAKKSKKFQKGGSEHVFWFIIAKFGKETPIFPLKLMFCYLKRPLFWSMAVMTAIWQPYISPYDSKVVFVYREKLFWN